MSDPVPPTVTTRPLVRYADLGMTHGMTVPIYFTFTLVPISDSGLPCVDVCEGKMLPLGRQLTVQHEHVQGSVSGHGMRTRNGSGPG